MNYPKNSIENIKELIHQNRLQEAMAILSQNTGNSPLFQNAMAVCLMRSGEARKAVEILTSLVYKGNSLAIDHSKASEVLILNLVTARLLMGNLPGAVSLLLEVSRESPMRQKLQLSIDAWKRSQSFFSRIVFALGLLPTNKPIPLDFPPGEV